MHTARDRDSDRDRVRERWVSILRYVLYTLHRTGTGTGNHRFHCWCPGPDPGPVQCVWAIDLSTRAAVLPHVADNLQETMLIVRGGGPFPSIFSHLHAVFCGKLAKIIGWYPTMELAIPLGMIALHSNPTFRKFNTFSGQLNELKKNKMMFYGHQFALVSWRNIVILGDN